MTIDGKRPFPTGYSVYVMHHDRPHTMKVSNVTFGVS